MIMPPDSPRDLRDFPEVPADGPYYKVHFDGTEAASFGNSSLYPFDPPAHRQRDFGTCYMTTSREGAFLETLGGIRPLSQRHVDARVITEMYTPEGLRIADPTTDWRYSGISMLEYKWSDTWGAMPLAQRWAELLYDAGFNGVQYVASRRRDWPEYAVVALWSEPGVDSAVVKSGEDLPIPHSILEEMTTSKIIEILIEEALALADLPHDRDSEAESSDDTDTGVDRSK
jgi:hypothetical protein